MKQDIDLHNWLLFFGNELKRGLKTGLVVALVLIVVIVAAVFLITRSYYSASVTPSGPPEQRSTFEHPAPAYSPVVAAPKITVRSVLGECFRTPMGDDGKVIEQANDMLTMSFKGGVKATYQFDQVTPSSCGPATR